MFTGDTYYPSGGWRDFKGSFDLVEEAEEEVRRMRNDKELGFDWFQIVDVQMKGTVSEKY